MNHARVAAGEVVFETDRLLLRRWRVSDAAVQRELWTERDPRVPPHRRIAPDGHPTLEDIEDWIRRGDPDASLGLLAAERRGSGDIIGYCGLIPKAHGQDGEPELAYEFLRKVWHQGYATEASWAVLSWAKESGYRRLWATVRDWNTASRRVMAKLGFVETARVGTGQHPRELAVPHEKLLVAFAIQRDRTTESFRKRSHRHRRVLRPELGTRASPAAGIVETPVSRFRSATTCDSRLVQARRPGARHGIPAGRLLV